MQVNEERMPGLTSAISLAVGFAVVRLLVQFGLTAWTTHLGYGYFRDEFYYVACGRHMAWGYVDHGPAVAVQARLSELLFGDSVFGLRVLAAVAGALTVGLTGLIAWALGGRRPAQALAMLGVMVCPEFLALDGFLSMNAWEPVFWMGCVLALLAVVRGWGERASWCCFGVLAGVGLLNKPSMAFFLLAAAGGLLLTDARRVLWSRWAAVAVLLLVLLALPNVLWQWRHGWPMLEFLRNGRAGNKNVVLGPGAFLLVQVNNMLPVSVVLWGAGVVALLRGRSITGARWLGLLFVLFFVGMLGLHAKDYYLAAVYPAYFAAGGVAWERRFAGDARVRAGRLIAFPVMETVLVVVGLLVLPMCSPVLRPAAWGPYTTAIKLRSEKTETLSTGPLPQFYADRFGWESEVALVRQGLASLTPEERRRACVFGSNYGEAGAIDFLGHMGRDAAAEEMPPAISGQNNYWLWGTHGCDPNVVVAVIRDSPEAIGRKYQSVVVVGRMGDAWSMPYEHRNVYVLRGRTVPFRWEDERFYY